MLGKLFKYASLLALIATMVMAICKLIGVATFGWFTVFMPLIALVCVMGIVLFFVVGIMLFMLLVFILFVIYEMAK